MYHLRTGKEIKEMNIFIAYWISSLWVKAAPSTYSAGLGFFRWYFSLLLQLKVKVAINNPIYPVLKWFCEWCIETGTNNIQAEMFSKILKCTILEMTGVQTQQAAGSLQPYLQHTSVAALSSHRLQWVLFCRGAACAIWDWPLELTQRKNAQNMFYRWIISFM